MGLLVFLIALDADAQMYKCVDERGKIQYTDKPQAGCKESAIKPSPPLSGMNMSVITRSAGRLW